MKKIMLLATGLVMTSIIYAQSDRYVNAMKANIAALDSGMSKGNMLELANSFERIAEAEKTQWLPYYYASYCNVMQAFLSEDKSKSDPLANKAEQLITKAETIAGKENSETLVIRSMIAYAHMMVDPQSRWQQYGAESSASIKKAKALDPSNPRPVYLEGQALFYTPESFGGGKGPAKPVFEKALAMFDQFKPASPLDPSWGKASTQYFLAQTNK